MWLGAPADKPGGPRLWVHVLLSATVLALVFAGMGMLLVPAGRLEAWGLDPAAIRVTLLPRLASADGPELEQQPYPQPAAPLPLGLDLEAGTPVYGRMDKRGPFPGLVEMAAGRSSDELSYRAAWSAQRLAGGDPPFPTKWCAVMINDRYKIIYLKCPKAAGNTLVRQGGLGAGAGCWGGRGHASHAALRCSAPVVPHAVPCLRWRWAVGALCAKGQRSKRAAHCPQPVPPAGQLLWVVPAGPQGILPRVFRRRKRHRSCTRHERVAGGPPRRPAL